MEKIVKNNIISREIVIGDIHGCFDELVELLKKVRFDEDNDTLIFVGDYSDRGEKSYEVYEYIKNLKDKMKDRLVLIMGNHEDLMLEYVKSNDKLWFLNGADKTIESFKSHDYSLKEYADFIKENTVLYYKSKLFDICHAGVYYGVDRDDRDTLLWDRSAISNCGFDGKLTIVGHTATKKPFLLRCVGAYKNELVSYNYNRLYDIPETGILDIDTGCVYDLKLTALVVNGNKMRFVKVDRQR